MPMPKATSTPSPSSKYSQHAERFRRQIELGELRVGDRLPSYVDMHRLHGVSRPTMDKVLDLLEAEGVIIREPGRGVFVANPKVVKAQGVIGVMGGLGAESNRHPYFAHILEGIHQVADRAGVEILLLSQTSNIQWEKVDGVLTCGMAAESGSNRLPPGMPFMRLFMPSTDSDSVITDDEQGTYEAAQYLLSLGHRRIAFLSSALYSSLSACRYAGYVRALREAGIDANPLWTRELIFVHGKSRGGYLEHGEDMMAEWLQSNWNQLGCTALLTANDDCAIGAIAALRSAGLDVPGDVSVVGFDGTEVSRYASPQLTTVEVPLRKIAERGTQILLQKMHQRVDASPAEFETVVVPAALVVRESTAPPSPGV